MQEALSLMSGASPTQLKVAEHLPPPLYFLFVQAGALREAGGKIFAVFNVGSKELRGSLVCLP